MNRRLAARRTLDAIAHLSDPDPPWTELLRGMQGLIGGDSATLMMIDGGGELLVFEQNDIVQSTQREYVDHFFASDIMVGPTLGAPPGTWFDTKELFSSSFLSRDEFYNDFMCRNRMQQLLTLIIEDTPQRRGGITVQRSGATDHARRHLESASVRRVTSSLRQGLTRREALAQQWIHGAEAAFGALGEAFCLVTQLGTVLRASAKAQELFDANGSVRVRGGRLWHPAAEIRQALSAGLRQAPQALQPVCLSVPGASGRFDQVEMVRAAPQLSMGKEVLVFVRIRDGRLRPSPSIDQLRSAFGITPAEARVLAALMAGQSPKQYAAAQDLSFHTVRSQIGSVMAKMDCKRQIDLVRMGLALGY